MHFKMLLEKLREKLKGANRRLILALAFYAVLIIVALVMLLPARTSNDLFVLFLLLAFFAYLIVKTIAQSGDDSK